MAALGFLTLRGMGPGPQVQLAGYLTSPERQLLPAISSEYSHTEYSHTVFCGGNAALTASHLQRAGFEVR